MGASQFCKLIEILLVIAFIEDVPEGYGAKRNEAVARARACFQTPKTLTLKGGAI